ncbi:MAG TPA: sulfur carrier protein ThiS [Candidatus Dormibacteraeota bacterium]|nr:sulfur carrier protein ThiS [Candidatus Dormibacteraeota bacterium]
MVTLQINGKKVELERPTPLVLYIEGLGINPRTVAVEHNGQIIQRAQFASVVLQEGDKVEIVRMVGGGQAGRAQGARPTKRPVVP